MRNRKINVCVYKGGMALVKNSGVGKAVFHQIDILKDQDVNVNKKSLFASDIVHINTVFPDSVLTALIARALGIKVVYYGHSTMEDFKNSFVGSNLCAPLFKQWIKFCYRLGDVIITPTKYSRKILKSYGIAKPIVSVSNGIDVSEWSSEPLDEKARDRFLEKYNIPKDKKIIMSVGHYIERKGISEFINLARENPDMTFVWFGYTNINIVPEQIRIDIETAPKNMIFAGYVESDELKKAYEYSDVFLFMSHEETEGIVILEAMAVGIPIIVRDIPVYEGWLFDGGNVLKFSKDEEVLGLLNKVLYEDTSLMVENAKKTALSRDYYQVGKRLLKVYRKLLNK